MALNGGLNTGYFIHMIIIFIDFNSCAKMTSNEGMSLHGESDLGKLDRNSGQIIFHMLSYFVILRYENI